MRITGLHWFLLVLFLIAYGAVVAFATRAYYKDVWAVGQPTTPAPTRAAGANVSGGIDTPTTPLIGTMQRFGTVTQDLGLQPSPGAESMPTTLEGLVARGDELFVAQQYERAATMYSHALEVAPDQVGIYNNLGLTLHYIGRSAEALERLRRGAELDPENARVHLTLGFVSAQMGQGDEAKSALREAVELEPDTIVGQEAKRMLEGL